MPKKSGTFRSRAERLEKPKEEDEEKASISKGEMQMEAEEFDKQDSSINMYSTFNPT